MDSQIAEVIANSQTAAKDIIKKQSTDNYFTLVIFDNLDSN